MKQLKIFLLPILAILLMACIGNDGTRFASNDGGISGTGDGTGTGEGASKSSISGAIYKGPLIKGSVIQIHKVIDGIVESELFSANTSSNKGDYSINIEPDEVNGSIVSITATGQYYDENTALFSSQDVELKGLALLDVPSEKSQTIYVNSLTHLAYDYTLSLLAQEENYEEATAQAQKRVLTVFSALTGEQNITGPFSSMSLINSESSNAADNAYLLYISALISKATAIQQYSTPGFEAQDLFDILIEDIVNEEEIDYETLDLLQTAHNQIDAASIEQILLSILVGETIAAIQTTVDDVSPGLEIPTNLHSVAVTQRGLQRFCYEGATDCANDRVTGNVNHNGMYTYELHTAVSGSNFAAPRIFRSARNNISIISGMYLPATSYDARLRKVWPDGQYSAWSEISFTTPP